MKFFLKILIGFTYYNLFRWTSKKNIVFLFHEISDKPSKYQKKNSLCLSKNNFIKLINYIEEYFHIRDKKKIAITFDDGFLGNFKFAIPYLIKKKIFSISFLNFYPIDLKKPNIDSKIDYFISTKKLKKNLRFKFNEQTIPKNFNQNAKITKYQGKIVSKKTLKKYSKNKFVFYANHLYDHYCVKNLSNKVLKENILKNKRKLSKYKCSLDFFAFPYGNLGEDFTYNQFKLTQKLVKGNIYMSDDKKKFYENKIINRISLTEKDINKYIFWFRVLKFNLSNRGPTFE